VGLQLNINKFVRYCERWSLRVNLNKSKIMVFRRGGRLSARERWKYAGEELEIVNEYKYLGVTLSSKLSFVSHLCKRIAEAKHAINSLWHTILIKENVPLSAKYEIYLSVCRSLTCYGAQVWGVHSYEVLEAFQRFFIKKLFSIPLCTPNSMIALETGLPPLFFYTLDLHIKYCLRVLRLPGHRLPKLLAEASISKNATWFNEWSLISGKYGQGGFVVEGRHQWREQWVKLREVMEGSEKQNTLAKSLSSERFLLYKCLLETNAEYRPLSLRARSSLKGHQSRWLFKLRGELLYLNKRPWETSMVASTQCSLCNTGAEEDTYHFIGVCPVLGDVRRLCCGKSTLSREEIVKCLAGEDSFDSLLLFAKFAWQKRYSLIREFNIR